MLEDEMPATPEPRILGDIGIQSLCDGEIVPSEGSHSMVQGRNKEPECNTTLTLRVSPDFGNNQPQVQRHTTPTIQASEIQQAYPDDLTRGENTVNLIP